MRISELFFSIQGEGINQGFPTVFVRTQGCSIHCSNCDTPYSWHPKSGYEMSLGDILRECERIGGGCRRLCITGGEPLEQAAETDALVKLAARVYGYSVEVETSGCVCISEERWPCSWVVDIKTPSAGVADKNIGNNLKRLDWNYGDCVVAVIRDKTDFDYVVDFAGTWLSGLCNLYFHPDNSVEDLPGLMKDIATWLKKEHSAKNWRMGYQLHRLIWGAQIGV